MNHKRLVENLLSWFASSARDLPWRRTKAPYAIWVSEIMLQQTQVKTVLPYWERWMEALPNIEALAKTAPQTIHKLWEGLGYYTRVRNMQKAAVTIMEKHAGEFPTSFEDVLALPGIGRYTAGAICSIAFNQPTPILDGNVIRVLTRLFGIGGDPHSKPVNAKLWRFAQEVVTEAARSNSCGELNQSLMELGALICTPREPRCGCCPVARQCVALRKRHVHRFPQLPPRPIATQRRFVGFILARNDRWLVRQRPAGAVNAHLWEFPNVEVQLNDGHPAAAARALGVRGEHFEAFCSIKHTITRYRICLDVYRVGRNGRQSRAVAGHWRSLPQLVQLPFTSAHKKVLQHLTLQST
jgi:A/G-specific adenine glycosylase